MVKFIVYGVLRASSIAPYPRSQNHVLGGKITNQVLQQFPICVPFLAACLKSSRALQIFAGTSLPNLVFCPSPASFVDTNARLQSRILPLPMRQKR